MKIKKPVILALIVVALIINQSCRTMKHADLILLNGKIITVNSNLDIFEGVAIAGNRILAAGSTEKVRSFADKGTEIIDLQGKTVVPGLIDSHLHPESASVSEIENEIPDIHSIGQLLGWIKEETLKKPAGEWIIFPKLFPTRLREMRQPTLHELDSVAPGHPVFLNGSFGGMINSAAMKLSGINSLTDHPGVIKNRLTGNPTGFIRASAFGLLSLPPQKNLTAAEKEDALLKMLKRYNEYGLTSLVSGAANPGMQKMYRDLADRKLLTARIYLNMLLETEKPVTREGVVQRLKQYGSLSGEGDEWVRTGSLKVFLDGGILTGTAYMKEPWGTRAVKIFGIEDPSYRGVVNYSKEELSVIVTTANDFNWSFTAHATGEAAVDMLLDAYSEANRNKPIKERRFSIIHGNFFNSEAIAKMAEMGVLANIQPAWFFKDAEAMDSILGHQKVAIFHPYRSLEDAGVIINGGSDHMVKWDATTSINPYNPFLAIWTMVTRKTENGSQLFPREALTREEALKAYTINNAFSTFEESQKGSIEPGKLADLAVLSDDILTCPEDSIREIKAIMTILDGKIIYERPGDIKILIRK
jgi:predicted amidohydrolase YtcJ